MIGSHVIKTWSSTLPSVSLSSGEAEFYGVVKAAGMGLGYRSLLADLGVELPVRVWTDSSAAIGVCSRQGLGKLRHLDTHTLWVQQAVRSGRIDLRKVPGTQNPADLLTKHSATRDKLGYLVSLFGCRYLGGRSEAAPRLRKDVEGAKRTLATEGRDGQLLAVEDAGPDDEWSETILPHLQYDPDRLNELYPSFLAADEGVNGDDELEAEDARDPILVRGMVVASEISEAMRTQGRVR